MKNILIIVAVMGVAVAGACGVMTIPGGHTTAQSCDAGIVGPTGAQHSLSLSVNDCREVLGKLFPGIYGVSLYAQADEDENGNGEEEKKEEEAPPVPSVDRLWDIVMSA